MRTAAQSLTTTLARTTSLAILLIASGNAWGEIAWQTSLRAAHAQAQGENKLLLLHFYSDNCTWCDRLEEGSFKSRQVNDAINQNFVPVKVHANSSPQLAEMFKVNKFPTDVIVTTAGKTLSHSVSPQDPNRYVAMLSSTLPALASTQPPAAAAPVAAVPQAPAPTAPAPTAPAPQPAVTQAPDYATSPAPAVASAPVTSAPVAEATLAEATLAEATLAEATVAEASVADLGGTSDSISLPSNELSLPTIGDGQVEASLAGSRSEGLTLGMPGQPSIEIEAPALELPVNASEVAAPQITPPQVTESGITAPQITAPQITAPQINESEITAPQINAPAVDQEAIDQTVEVKPPADIPVEHATAGTPLPAEQPELAMQGFCPVTVIQEDKWVEGSPEFGVIHLGKLYLFTSNDKMKQFLADPVPFTPVLNEIDVVRFFEERKIVPGKREWGLKDPIYNRMFFFADEAAMNHFYNEYERYTDAAIEVMDKAVKDANPGT